MKGFFDYLTALIDAKLGRTTPGEASVRLDGEPLGTPMDAEACEAMRFRAQHIEPIEDET